MTTPGFEVGLALLRLCVCVCVFVDAQDIIKSKSWNRRLVTLDTSAKYS